MPSEWIRVDHASQRWEFDAGFLASNWTCIWDKGCAGIAEQADVAGQLGCCSVGAEMLDENEAMKIAALGASLDPSTAQFADAIAAGGVVEQRESDRSGWATRVVDGACILLNRPGFEGGAGCALHVEALAAGESPIDWKPSVCWQLPIKVEQVVGEDGAPIKRLRGWLRSDWGPEGTEMAYCCTERDSELANAYVGESPVFQSLSGELEALLGNELMTRLVEEL